MASQGSKGLTKKHSARQKEHYKAHYFKLMDNKITRLKAYVRRNLRRAEKKGTGVDRQAIRRLKELTEK